MRAPLNVTADMSNCFSCQHFGLSGVKTPAPEGSDDLTLAYCPKATSRVAKRGQVCAICHGGYGLI